MFKAKTLWESFSKRGKIIQNTFLKNGSVNSGWGVKRGWFYLFENIFSKGFCFVQLFLFFQFSITFSKRFCFERLCKKSEDFYVLENLGWARRGSKK